MKKKLIVLFMCTLLIVCVFGISAYAVNSDFQIENGVLMRYIGNDEKVTIPDGVTSIEERAFYRRYTLNEINIPDDVTSIGNNPFMLCPSLQKIIVSPDHPTIAAIDNVLFSKDDKRLVTYPCGLDASSYTIPYGILCIGDYAFCNCIHLSEISIPDTVISIGNDAFSWCDSLTEISIPDSVTSIGNWAFADCTSLTEISIPDSVTSIGDRAFADCTSLTEISIPDSVTYIGINPFIGCRYLQSVTISPNHPALEVIKNVLFCKEDNRLVSYPCSKHNLSYTIPGGTLCIGKDAFYECSDLYAIYIPDSVTSIEDEAFADCSYLTKISIPNSITSIGDRAFFNCTSLTEIFLPDSITFIGSNAFYGCSSLSITVGRDSYAAQYCKDNGLNYTYTDALDWLPTATPAPTPTATPARTRTITRTPTAAPTQYIYYEALYPYQSSGEAVKTMQQRLKELGYYDGDISGNYLTKTTVAVQQFQQVIGAYEDGVASSYVLERLYAANAPYQSGTTPVPTDTQEPTSESATEVVKIVTIDGDDPSIIYAVNLRLIILGWIDPNEVLTNKYDDQFILNIAEFRRYVTENWNEDLWGSAEEFMPEGEFDKTFLDERTYNLIMNEELQIVKPEDYIIEPIDIK